MNFICSLLDSRTMVVHTSLSYAALALVMLHTLLNRKTYPGFGYWTAGILAWAFGVFFNFFPNLIGVNYGLALSNILTMFQPALLYHGFALYCNFNHLKINCSLNYVLAVSGALAMIYFRLFDDNYSYRAISYSLVNALIFLRIAFEPFLRREATVYPTQKTIATLLMLFTTLFFLRCYDNLLLNHYLSMEEDPVLKLILLCGTVASTVLVFCMHSMTSFRVEKELLLAQDQLKILADTDSLTAISNRRHFMGQSEKIIQAAKRYGHEVSLLMLDIDHFKRINDTMGHAVGDLVLKEIAKLLISQIREVDVLGRLGGEEFGILLPETGLHKAVQVAERIRAEIERVRPQGFEITVSIGAAQFKDNGLDELMLLADDCLYAAKRRGRNQVCQPDTPAAEG